MLGRVKQTKGSTVTEVAHQGSHFQRLWLLRHLQLHTQHMHRYVCVCVQRTPLGHRHIRCSCSGWCNYLNNVSIGLTTDNARGAAVGFTVVGNTATGTDNICCAAAGFAVVGNKATGINEDRVSMFVSSHTGAPVVARNLGVSKKYGL